MKYKVSIVIITKNREESLRKCIESLRKQNFDGKKEIIVVDSSDTPLQMKGVKYIYNKKAGIASARNIGIKTLSIIW